MPTDQRVKRLLHRLKRLVADFEAETTGTYDNTYHGGRVPFGFRLVGGKLKPNHDELATLARMFELRRNGFSQQVIADKLNQEGHAARGRHNEPSTWNQSMVSRMLGSRH